jgi:hypothetical protein
LRDEAGFSHFKLRRSDLLYALPTEGHQIIRCPFVNDEVEFLYRSGPICTGFENILDALLIEVAARLSERCQEIGVNAIFAAVAATLQVLTYDCMSY